MEIELKRLVMPLIKRWWIILLATVIVALSKYYYSSNYITPVYTANITMYVQNTSDYDGYISTGDLESSKRLLSTYIVLLKSNNFMKKVAEDSGLGYSASEINSMVTASAINDTEVLRVSVRNTKPVHAQIIANAIGDVAPDEVIRVFNAGNVEVIDEALLPVFPSYPNVSQEAVKGGLFGFVIACVLIIMKELLDTRIKSEADLRQVTEIPVVGIIPGAIKYKKSKRSNSAVLTKNSPGIVIEAYRSARTNLLFLLSSKSYKKVLISSASPSEGKTTTCANIAITFAKANKKVLVIDGDMRNPGLHKLFSTVYCPGLSDILGGFTDTSCVIETDIENLSFLPAGTIPPNPAELLVSDKFNEMLSKFSETYDYIFIDTPPSGMFSDSLSLTAKFDGIIMVAKYAWTRKERLKSLLDIYNKVDANLLGIVINNYDFRSFIKNYGTGKKGKYFNKYGYNYNYGETERL